MPNIDRKGVRDLNLELREDACVSSDKIIEARIPEIKVVVGAVFNNAGQVLIARRAAHLHQGDKWEFPGGKLESGESTLDTLRRELFEELGIQAQAFEPLIQVHYQYPNKAVFLDAWKVTRYTGTPYGREAQPLVWAAGHELSRFTFPAANLPILKALNLPDRYLITPAPEGDDALFLSCLEDALKRGIKLVQLRAPSLTADRYCELAQAAIECCHAHGAQLLVNSEPEWAVRLQADGVHLNSARLKAMSARPLSAPYLVAVSCHDASEIARANAIEADLAVLSPVKATPSHPTARPLGWRAFGALCTQALMPVYALGGMNINHLLQAKHCGGQGVAAIRGLWPCD